MSSAAPKKKLTLLSLSAATFFIVSGGPYGLEEIVTGHGYARTLLLLVLVPIVWSVPVGLMVGELGAAIPETGGYYAWVKRALGPFWALQEAWLSFATSLFDMAIYPTLFVTYLGGLFPSIADTSPGKPGWWIGLAMIATCALWNAIGSRAVGIGSAALALFLFGPFVAIVIFAVRALPHGGLAIAKSAFSAGAPATGNSAWIAGVMICMWNYMGFDNAATVASEVVNPQRVYPRAMLLTTAVIVVCYAIPVIAASASGLAPEAWEAGSWVEVGRRFGGPALGWLVALGGAISAFGMFNALILSWSRLPVALADDGFLPRVFARRAKKNDAPDVSIALCAVLYAMCMGIGLKRLMEIDVMLYGASLLLEFVALIVLRVKEPKLPRPFKIPGGLAGVIAIAAVPTLLLAYATWMGRDEEAMLGLTSLQVCGLIAMLGPIWWVVDRWILKRRIGPAAS